MHLERNLNELTQQLTNIVIGKNSNCKMQLALKINEKKHNHQPTTIETFHVFLSLFSKLIIQYSFHPPKEVNFPDPSEVIKMGSN